jgi:hypothetical protein
MPPMSYYCGSQYTMLQYALYSVLVLMQSKRCIALFLKFNRMSERPFETGG